MPSHLAAQSGTARHAHGKMGSRFQIRLLRGEDRNKHEYTLPF
jgi:hypothetical protein